MKKKNKHKGISTILVILIVLTIVLFAVMSMMSVYTSYRISQKNLQMAKNYYLLDSKAQIFANNMRKTINMTKIGEENNKAEILSEIEKNRDKDREILINDTILEFPLDKDREIFKDGNMKLGTFLLDEKGQKSFYFELLIPKIREDKAFEITSWKKVNQEFEYKNPTFAEGEELTIDEN